MISKSPGNMVLRHTSGRYLEIVEYRGDGYIDRDLHYAVTFCLARRPHSRVVGGPEDWVVRWAAQWGFGGADWSLELAPRCQCCGERPHTWIDGHLRTVRCQAHGDRNPCIIEGCTRTGPLPESHRLSNDDWICGTHWRAYVPPRSRERRAYHRFFSIARKRGWDEELAAKFHRFWRTLVALARKRADGDRLDMREINKIMGWE